MPNVEPSKFQILGSLPIPGDELLASMNITTSVEPNAESQDLPGVLLPRVTPTEPTLPSLGKPLSE